MTGPISNQPNQNSHVSNKTFSQDTTQKSYGSGAAGSNTELAQWYEQAYTYYQEWAGKASQGEFPPELNDPSAWGGFMQQMEWAAGQLGLAGGYQNVDPGQNYQAGYNQANAGIPQNPNGIPVGASGQGYIANKANNELTFYGDNSANYPTDVWGELTLNVEHYDATVEVTMGVHPQTGETVRIIKVTSPALGKEKVYYDHDYASNPELHINMGDPTKIKSSANVVGPVIVEEFKAAKVGGTQQGSQPDRMEGDIGIYEENSSVTLHPRDDEDTESEIYANRKVTIHSKPTSEISVENSDDGEWITVKVKNGDETDTYQIKKYEDQEIDFPDASPGQITGLEESDMAALQQKGDVENAVTITLHGETVSTESLYTNEATARAEVLSNLLGNSVSKEDILENEDIMEMLDNDAYSDDTWAQVAIFFLNTDFSGGKEKRISQALAFLDSGILETLEEGDYAPDTVLRAAKLADEMGIAGNNDALVDLFSEDVLKALDNPDIAAVPPAEALLTFLSTYDDTLSLMKEGHDFATENSGTAKNNRDIVRDQLVSLLNIAFNGKYTYTASNGSSFNAKDDIRVKKNGADDSTTIWFDAIDNSNGNIRFTEYATGTTASDSYKKTEDNNADG